MSGEYDVQVLRQRDAARAALAAAEARIAAALAVVGRFDEYLLLRDAVADLRDALNGTVGGMASPAIRTWADHAGRMCAGGGPCLAHDSPASTVCCACGSGAVVYANFRGQPFCWPCASGCPGHRLVRAGRSAYSVLIAVWCTMGASEKRQPCRGLALHEDYLVSTTPQSTPSTRWSAHAAGPDR